MRPAAVLRQCRRSAKQIQMDRKAFVSLESLTPIGSLPPFSVGAHIPHIRRHFIVN